MHFDYSPKVKAMQARLLDSSTGTSIRTSTASTKRSKPTAVPATPGSRPG